MKHISQVIYEMQKSGKLPTVIVTEVNPMITAEEAQAVLFKMYADALMVDYTVIYICELFKNAVKKCEQDSTKLIPLSVASKVLSNIVMKFSKDKKLAQELSDAFKYKAQEEEDFDFITDEYKIIKNIILKETK